MNIGLFCQEYPPRPHGGIGTFVRALAEELARRGFRVCVVEFGDHADERVQNGVQVVTLRGSRRPALRAVADRLRLWAWVRRAFRQGRIELFELPEFQGWMPLGAGGCPVVVRLQLAMSLLRENEGLPPHVPTRVFERLTLRRADAWIPVSRWIQDRTERHFGLKPPLHRVIHNAIAWPEPPAEGLDRGEPYCLFVGNLRASKGVLVLAGAMRRVWAEWPELGLVYVGADGELDGGPLSARIRERVGEAQAHRVRFVGAAPNAEALAWMAGARLLAMPSRLEAFALVPLEAMALGVPVVYTTACAGPEVIRDGVDGLLVDPEDEAALAAAILRLVRDPGLAARLGAAGRETARTRFGLGPCVDATLELYYRVLDARARRSARP